VEFGESKHVRIMREYEDCRLTLEKTHTFSPISPLANFDCISFDTKCALSKYFIFEMEIYNNQ
jgi:hypothetical protein